MKKQLALGRDWAEDWLLKTRETADRTTLIILGGADDLYDWALASLDNTLVSKFTSLPPTVDLRGS